MKLFLLTIILQTISSACQFEDQYGFNRLLRALRLSKTSWYYAQKRESYEEKYRHLRKPLLEIAREHPEYGYRRTSTEFKAQGFYVIHKVIERLHSCWTFSVLKRVKHPKGSSIRALLRRAGSKVNFVSSFTEIGYRNGPSKARFIAIIDHRSKLVVGRAIGESANTDLALKA